MSPTRTNGIDSQPSQRSDRFWFDDGTVLVSLVPSVYRVHKSILDQRSTKFASWVLDAQGPSALALSKAVGDHGTPIIAIPGELSITAEDFEALLAHLYHAFVRSRLIQYRYVGGTTNLNPVTQSLETRGFIPSARVPSAGLVPSAARIDLDI